MKQETKGAKSTCVGPYVWNIDIDTMSLEELMALERLCHDKQKEQLHKEYRKRLITLIQTALDNGVNFSFEIKDEELYLTDIMDELTPVEWP